ncbi:hypothetical protein LRP67_19420 [Nocardioides sp. cx-169]|uniref:hypothetical protein n=1 Tax=Nocardioides sp. cx-169 TaxID=2899080 RepID=UPI001E60DF36|nr:hypothetical protein [Nocardioides sp. cx-169]MCD4536267.1 hypothetical protein [Nocardioides sp. cx-169]
MKILLALLTALLLTAALTGLARAEHGPPGDRVHEPPVIVEVEGDAANGFGIHYSDGSELSPPTDSEAFAECGEYGRRVARVRCRTEVRVWYRDLGDLKRALEHARS